MSPVEHRIRLFELLMSTYRLLTQYFCALLWVLLALPAFATDLLPPQRAFAAHVERQGARTELVLTIAPDYYLYRQRTHITTDPASLLDQVVLPAGQHKDDPFMGPQEIYAGQIRIPLSLNSPAQHFTLMVKLQGCAEVAKVCYPPYTHTLQVGPKGTSSPSSISFLGSSPQDSPVTQDQEETVVITLGSYYLAGLGLAFTACMYPLLPILSSLIAGHGVRLTRRRGLLLSLSYIQGLALCYTLIGVVAALTGSLLTLWLQQPAVVLTAAALMVVFALAMFGVWNMQLPSSWQTTLTRITNRLPGGHYLTVFVTGALSALIIGPCVAPPLALALGYIASTGDAALGGLALYVMALGLGTPLLIVGYFGGSTLPKAGAWMQGVKNLFGVIMLGLAIYVASPFLPPRLVLVLWGLLAMGCALWLLIHQRQIKYKLDKLLGTGMLMAALIQFTGAAAGSTDPLRPIPSAWLGQATVEHESLQFQTIHSLADWQNILQQHAGQPIMLDFYADWCVACKELEHKTFTDPAVASTMRRYVLVRVDVTDNTPQHQALLKHFGLFGPPGIILIGQDGRETHRIIGFVPPEKFLPALTNQ